MAFDEDLLAIVPLRQQAVLSLAIGKSLVDIRRLFYISAEKFVEYNSDRQMEDYFAWNSGVTSFFFSEGLVHTFGVWGEALSLVVYREPVKAIDDARLVSLTDTPNARSDLKWIVGSTCKDVRIWTLKDLCDEREPKQVGVSYCFTNGVEILFSIYLQGEGDNDSLTIGLPPFERVASCFSIEKKGDILSRLDSSPV